MSDFMALQQQWTTWLRQPSAVQMPHVESRRLFIYRELFFNNISSFVENTFPLLKKHLPAQHWQSLLEDFFAKHYCQTPYFAHIADEFLQFLGTQSALLQAYPWMFELAHFEWVELAAEIADDSMPVFVQGDFWQQIPVVSPFVWPLVYQWPVQSFAQQKNVPEPEACSLILYRNQQHDVQVMQTNPLTLMLLQKLQHNHQQTGTQIFADLAQQLQTDKLALCAAGQEIVEQFIAADILLGVRC